MVPDSVLLIEILSPSNEAQTRSNIWTHATIPSVREILAIRSTRMEAELLHRGSDGTWPASPTIIRPPQHLELAGIGFIVPIGDIHSTTGLSQ
jgi:hypothetical protein